MVLKPIDSNLAIKQLLRDFGLESNENFRPDSDTVLTLLACLARRASGIIGPNSQSNLTRAVLEPLHPLLNQTEEQYAEIKESLEMVIDSLTAIGDLREESAPRREIYPGYPSFVKRRNGDVILLGVVSETKNSVPEPLVDLVSHQGILRRLETEQGKALVEKLGLTEITEEMWTQTPIAETPQEHVARFVDALNRSSQSPDALEFQRFLNPLEPCPENRFDYRKRWKNGIPQNITVGIAVARESETGPWFLVEVGRGKVEKCLPWPISAGPFRVCDEAWRFQFALDAVKADAEKRPRPLIRVEEVGGLDILKLYSPPLACASRKWDLIASKLTKEECVEFECLFGWRFGPSGIENEIPFIEETLWHSVVRE